MSLLPLPLLLLLSALLLGQHAGLGVEEKCRECICGCSHGCGPIYDCWMPDKGVCIGRDPVYCGPYAMSSSYWSDAGSHGSDFYSCMADWSCANQTLDGYIARFCTVEVVGHGPPCSCEEQFRIHYCGPKNVHTEDCDTYYQLFLPCMAN